MDLSGEFILTVIRGHEPQLSPVGPIGSVAISVIGDDEEELFGAVERDIDVHAVVRRNLDDDRGLEERLRGCVDKCRSEECEQDALHAGRVFSYEHDSPFQASETERGP